MKPRALFLLAALLCLQACEEKSEIYVIESEVQHKNFRINFAEFKAKKHCTGWYAGDQVVFRRGGETGDCVSTTVHNLTRGGDCELWCENNLLNDAR